MSETEAQADFVGVLADGLAEAVAHEPVLDGSTVKVEEMPELPPFHGATFPLLLVRSVEETGEPQAIDHLECLREYAIDWALVSVELPRTEERAEAIAPATVVASAHRALRKALMDSPWPAGTYLLTVGRPRTGWTMIDGQHKASVIEGEALLRRQEPITQAPWVDPVIVTGTEVTVTAVDASKEL